MFHGFFPTFVSLVFLYVSPFIHEFIVRRRESAFPVEVYLTKTLASLSELGSLDSMTRRISYFSWRAMRVYLRRRLLDAKDGLYRKQLSLPCVCRGITTCQLWSPTVIQLRWLIVYVFSRALFQGCYVKHWTQMRKRSWEFSWRSWSTKPRNRLEVQRSIDSNLDHER